MTERLQYLRRYISLGFGMVGWSEGFSVTDLGRRPYLLTIYPGKDRQYYWKMERSMGGKTVADGGEGKPRRHDVLRYVRKLPFDFAKIAIYHQR